MTEPPDSDRRILFQGRIVSVDEETAVYPDGQRVPLEIVRHPGGAAVVALDAQERVCMLRQYRHVIGGWLWELPAGKHEPGRSPLETAVSELAEEAGMHASVWHELGVMHSSPGVFTEVVHLFMATELTPVAPSLEQGELLEVHWLDLTEAVERACRFELSDAKTVVALHRAAAVRRAPSPSHP